MRYEDMYAEIVAGTARRTVTRWATGVLRDIANGRQRIRAVRHPLGFLLPAARTPRDAGRVPAHLVARLSRRTDDVAGALPQLGPLSLVLYGAVEQRPRAVIDEGDSHRMFEVVSQRRRATRSARRRVRSATRRRRPSRSTDRRQSTPCPRGLPQHVRGRARRPGRDPRAGAHPSDGADLSLGALDGSDHSVRRHHCDAVETSRTATAGMRLLDPCRRLTAGGRRATRNRPRTRPAGRRGGRGGGRMRCSASERANPWSRGRRATTATWSPTSTWPPSRCILERIRDTPTRPTA